MVLDSNPRTPVSPSDTERVINTPINTGHHTLYRFDNKCLTAFDQQHELAIEMSPYFVGPMPVSAFLEEFLPSPQVVLPFKEGMFSSVLTSQDEAGMYDPFVCPWIIMFYSRVYFSF
jgi:hypothetical protein